MISRGQELHPVPGSIIAGPPPIEESAVTEGPAEEQDGRQVPASLVLARAACTAVIDAQAGKVDLPEWLRTLPDREFQRCAVPDHKAVGYTVTDDGRPLSVMVEAIGASLFVHHYEYQVASRTHCRLVSVSDLLTAAGWTTCQVVWELTADPVDAGASRCTSALTCRPTAGLMRSIAAAGQTFGDVAAAIQAALDEHCQRETPRYAESLSRHANALN
jgi:hypothetical protein